jgi:hypothetical protein
MQTHTPKSAAPITEFIRHINPKEQGGSSDDDLSFACDPW